MTVLAIAPHPDDESIGCGGALHLHHQRGDRVVVAFLTSGELALKHLPTDEARTLRENEARLACKALGVSREAFFRGRDWFLDRDPAPVACQLERLLAEERPEVIFVPHTGENHPDHRIAFRILESALSRVEGLASSIFTYEVWTPLARYNHLINVGQVFLQKMTAIGCYESQLAMFRYDEAIAGLNRYRGILHAGWTYAEAYENLSRTDGHLLTGLHPDHR